MKEKCNEFLKLLNDFKAIRLGTAGDTAKLEDLNKHFTDFKLRFNSFTLKGSQFTDDETRQKFDIEEYQEICAGIDRLESMIQLRQVKFQLHQRLSAYTANIKDCGDEFCKLLDNPEAVRIDPRGVETRMQDLYNIYKEYKLTFNSLMHGYQISNPELYEEVRDKIDKVDDLEPKFQLVFNNLAKKIQENTNI